MVSLRPSVLWTEMLRDRVAATGVEPESVTFSVKFDVPFEPAGVPVIFPALFKESPAGSEPDAMLHVNGLIPPIAIRGTSYALLKTARGRALVRTSSGQT